jgi:hypothetical protein
VPIHQVAKTMTLMVDQQPRLVVTRGDQRIDMHKARPAYCTSYGHSYSHSSYSRSYSLLTVSTSTTQSVALLTSWAAGKAVTPQSGQAPTPRAVPTAVGGLCQCLLGGTRPAGTTAPSRLQRLQHVLRASARMPVAAAAKLLV